MAETLHPLAPHDMPSFITAPGSSDSLMTMMMFGVPAAILLLGVTFFWLHTLPERLGHKKLQFEVVAVLGLISLFTHMHVFWIIGLLLALIDLPDVLSPLRRIASAAERIAVPPPAEEAEPQLPAAEPLAAIETPTAEAETKAETVTAGAH